MDDDEEVTVRTLTSYRDVISKLIQQYRGAVVDTPGDNLLAEFTSVVDAVQCAVEVQQIIKIKNQELPEERRMYFRIGVNLGDVIEEGYRIYGDGVNIAARVEGLTNAGGICISESAYEQIENKLPLKFEFMGEHLVKNIPKPIRVYRAQLETEVLSKKKKIIDITSPRAIALIFGAILFIGVIAIVILKYFLHYYQAVEPSSIERMQYPLSDKLSIAVLPFVNMSRYPEDEYIADGITEDIITAIAKIDGM